MDLQHDRAELEIVGWGPGYESWSLAYITVYGDPAAPHLWQEVDRVLSREFQHQSGMPLRISAACLDAGYLPDEVLAFTKKKRNKFGAQDLWSQRAEWGMVKTNLAEKGDLQPQAIATVFDQRR